MIYYVGFLAIGLDDYLIISAYHLQDSHRGYTAKSIERYFNKVTRSHPYKE
jgi:hypothetical protein